MTTMTTAPPQHMIALAEANRVRLKRAALKRELAAGATSPRTIIEEGVPEWAETMPLGEFLRAQHRWGRSRVRKFCAALAVNENRRLGALTLRQRALIAASLR